MITAINAKQGRNRWHSRGATEWDYHNENQLQKVLRCNENKRTGHIHELAQGGPRLSNLDIV
jgi:hypothetical protein